MRRWFLAAVMALMIPVPGEAGDGDPGDGDPGDRDPLDHSALDRVLAAYVDEGGRVDYTGLKSHPEDLDAYVGQIGRVSPVSHPGRFRTRADSLAYWINAYNAFVLKGVVDAYPVKSVKDIKILMGFFSRTVFVAGGQEYTLNDIEHKILREKFKDPRIHAAINCASVGCPRLPREAFDAWGVYGQLQKAMRTFIREDRNVRIDQEETAVYVSRIFDWFEDDFTSWLERTQRVRNATIIDYLTLYVTEQDAGYLAENPDVEVRHVDYDWSLNDQASK